MSYLAYFRDLVTETTGIVRYYDVSPRYYRELVERHNGKISGSNGNYVAYDKAVTRTYVVFYVPEIMATVKIDIREKIMNLTGLKKMSPKFIKAFKANMPKQVYIESKDKKWTISESNLIKDVIRNAGY